MKKRKGLKIVLIILLVLILVPALVLGGLIIGGNKYINDRINREEITGDMNISEEEIFEGETVAEEDSVDEMEAVRQEFEQVQQMEFSQMEGVSNILLIGADRHGKNENVCIPRTDGHVWSMLNAAYSWGGPNLLIDTIELNFRIQIDHYVVVDFTAFEKAVDLLGGVELELTDDEAWYVSAVGKLPTPAGKSVLDGKRALVFSRIRLIDNDFKRTARQRKVITALIKKAKNMDLSTMLALADEILPLVSTNMTNSEILVYITRALPMLKNEVTQRMLPIENEDGKTYYGRIFVGGREMYRVDFVNNIKAFHDFINS